jgi:hypothetical protein
MSQPPPSATDSVRARAFAVESVASAFDRYRSVARVQHGIEHALARPPRSIAISTTGGPAAGRRADRARIISAARRAHHRFIAHAGLLLLRRPSRASTRPAPSSSARPTATSSRWIVDGEFTFGPTRNPPGTGPHAGRFGAIYGSRHRGPATIALGSDTGGSIRQPAAMRHRRLKPTAAACPLRPDCLRSSRPDRSADANRAMPPTLGDRGADPADATSARIGPGLRQRCRASCGTRVGVLS